MADSIARRASAVIDRKIAATYAFLQNMAGQMEGEAKAGATWKDRTSHARQGLHAGVDRHDKQFIIYLSHGVEYGELLETGTKPHIIRPKEKKALFWAGARHPVKLVRHPGTRSYAIVGPTMDANEARIKRGVLDIWS